MAVDLNEAVRLGSFERIVQQVHENRLNQIGLRPHHAVIIVKIYFHTFVDHVHVIQVQKQGFGRHHGKFHLSPPGNHDV